ncbi:nucleotidyltransferase family protein [Sulfurimonas lithotrophica]|uniref:Nucleotidyltransferase family protein n=1 Tax=Sulfurimonas lithotrophica TaxID=2590022 RepID=A0A5P8NY54_9BACT|nr:nucleotidyltransferase family protein [Sulfurimonas lithotrophica]QFR48362.1 nucleotidyltransferase family protein [Sulfurimonas lithotrophica]
MKALLLAAGLGTRLRPVTDKIPKCLVPINGKPLLEYWLDSLSKSGVTQFLINTSYLHEQVEEFISNSKYKNIVTLVYEKTLLNTGGTLLENRDFFDDEAFFLVHADNLSFCDFKGFINTHKNRPNNTHITMMLFHTDNPSSCGIVELDEQGVVQKFHEKVENPPSNLANGAVYICEPDIFKYLKSLNKKNIDFSNDVLPNYLGKINTFLNDAYHRDIGTIESYAIAQIESAEFVKS